MSAPVSPSHAGSGEPVSAIDLRVETPEAMGALGSAIANQLVAGDLVMLNGELGAGKTTLTRGLGARLGVRGAVTSPTFVLARTHPREGGAPLVHVDAYRLSSPLELDDLDIDFENSIVVVEWGAGMLDGIADNWLTVDIVRPTGGASTPSTGSGSASAPDPVEGDEAVEPRTVTLSGHGPRWSDLGWVGAPRD